jgi:NADPH:quinone reductase-like Zn-dependent oxidoreductase
MDMVQSIGANHVIDYTQEDFTMSGERYHLIVDTVGTHSLTDYTRALTHEGTLVLVGGPDDGNWLSPLTGLLKTVVLSWFVRQNLRSFLAHITKDDLTILQEFLETGKVVPVIDRRYPLREVPEAIRYLEEGHARGKVVITMEHGSET